MDEEIVKQKVARTIAEKIVKVTTELDGELIKDIFKDAEEIAELHSTLTSSRGNFFRMQLLHKLEKKLTQEEIVKLCEEAKLVEADRHLNKLLKFRLIERDDNGYIRTKLGEDAINELRALERRIGEDSANKIYRTSLGVNSIRLFLRVYGQKKESDLEKLKIVYTPLEIGKLAFFLPRSAEGIAAIDKLNMAGLLSYEDDGNIHLNPRKSRSFYQYLQALYRIKEDAKNDNN